MAEPNWRELVGYKSFEQLLSGFQSALTDAGVPVTNWNRGGVTRTVFELVSAGIERVYALAADLAQQGFVTYARREWVAEHLKNIGSDFAPARRAQGTFTVSCTGALTLRPGHTFATPPSASGKVYRFNVRTETTCITGANAVPVEALGDGTAWNVAPGTVTIAENVPPGVSSVTNGSEWLTREGTDEESVERGRERYYGEFADAAGETAEQFEQWALEADSGVVLARAIQVRGPGTVDLVIVGPEGVPSSGLIETVDAYVQSKRLLCRDVLVRGPTEVPTSVEATIWLSPDTSDALDDAETLAVARVAALFTPDPDITDVRALGVGRSVYLTGALMDALKGASVDTAYVQIALPASNVTVGSDGIAVLSAPATITVARLVLNDDGTWSEP